MLLSQNEQFGLFLALNSSTNTSVLNLIKQLFHSRLLDMRLVIANSYPTRACGIIVKYHFEIILEETLRSLEENGIKFVLKAKQKKAIEQFYEKNNLLAILPTGYGKSLIYQLFVLLAKRAGNYASYVSNNASSQN